MTMQAQDIRDRALRVIAYGSAKMMQEFLAEIDPDGYYPEATKRKGLWIHIARVVCAKEQEQGENECDFCGWFDGKHSPTCKVTWSPVPKCYEL